jgi:hypothetical protein
MHEQPKACMLFVPDHVGEGLGPAGPALLARVSTQEASELDSKPTTPGGTSSTKLAGKLEEGTLAGLLQMLSATRRSGKLTLATRDAHGLVLLQDGNIIYAASNSAREAFGNILIRHRLIDDGALMQALEQQHVSGQEKRLGTILVETGAISQENLENVLREQTVGIIRELLSWHEGFFTFEPLTIAGQEMGVDANDLVMDEGLDAELLSHGSAKPVAPVRGPARTETPQGTATAVQGEPVSAATLTTLKEVMTELRAPTFGGEITVWLLRHAAGIMKRCVLFSYSRDWIRGMGQVGLDPEGGGGAEEISNVRVPANETSVFTRVVETRESYQGELPRGPWNEYLAIQLGGLFPPEVVVVPMIVNGNVVALLYGDNLPGGSPIGPIDALELIMLEAGLAMEKTTLEIRLRTLQERLGGA